MGVHSFLPVSKLGGKSVEVDSFFPVLVRFGKVLSVGVRSFSVPVSKLGEKSAGVYSFFPVLGTFGKILVWGYTLSCLLANWEGRVQG